jgi:hypothetical protein
LKVWRVENGPIGTFNGEATPISPTYPGLIFPDIEEGARRTVVENYKKGPVIKRWEPFPDHLQPDAVPRGRVFAQRLALIGG